MRFEGTELIACRPGAAAPATGAREMSMIFQDPMTVPEPGRCRSGARSPSRSGYHLGRPSRTTRRTRRVALLSRSASPSRRQRLRRVPPPALRRHAPAGRHRHRARLRPEAAASPTSRRPRLDVTVQAQILDLLARQQPSGFMAMILVTHDLGVVAGRRRRRRRDVRRQDRRAGPHGVLFADMRCRTPRRCSASIPKLDEPSHTRLADDPGPPAGPRRPAGRLPFAPALPVRPGPKCLRGGAAAAAGRRRPDHVYRCWFPVGTPEGGEARARNEREGRVPAVGRRRTTVGAAD